MAELVPLRSNYLVPNGEGGTTTLTPEGTIFEITPERLALFQDSNGNWLEDWPTVRAIMICRTEDCSQNGSEIETILAVNVDGVFRCNCGGTCSNQPDLYEAP